MIGARVPEAHLPQKIDGPRRSHSAPLWSMRSMGKRFIDFQRVKLVQKRMAGVGAEFTRSNPAILPTLALPFLDLLGSFIFACS